jgi:predicted secreted Zn-dependent protease
VVVLALLLLGLLRAGVVHYSAVVSKNLPRATFASALRTAAPPASATSAKRAAPALASAPTPSVHLALGGTPDCTPDSTYTLPTAPDLSTTGTGLIQVVDQPMKYDIFGNTGSEIEQQIEACAPRVPNAGGVFTAYTSYAISWNYDYFVTGSGQCSLTDEKVGVHINQVFPAWQSTVSAEAGLGAEWQTFMTNLRTHEQGHVVLDLQYAKQMLSDMQTFPATDCANIAQITNAKLNNDVAALNQANDDYDARTNHGATQGAIIP